MRKIFLVGTALIAMTIAAACSGGSSSDDATTSPTPTPSGSPTATPTPVAGPFNISVSGTGWPHNGLNAYVRVLDLDSANRVVLCKGPLVIASMAWTASSNGAATAGHRLKAESWVDLNADGNFDPGAATLNDHDYSVSAPAAAANVTMTIAHGSTADMVTWTANTGCPG